MPISKKKVGGVGGVIGAIIAAVFAVEGGYVNNPKDPGGETNHGVTIAVAQQHKADLQSTYNWDGTMKNLSQDMAADIYYKDYVLKPGFVPFADVSPAVTEKLVDAGVNTGPSRPSRWLQESLNSFSRDGKDYPKIQVDGKVGAGTLQAYKSLRIKRGKVEACKLMLKSIDGKQTNYYLSLNMPEFTTGWITNRIGNVPLEKCNEDINY
jgi:lysozyme family protein